MYQREGEGSLEEIQQIEEYQQALKIVTQGESQQVSEISFCGANSCLNRVCLWVVQ